MNSLKQIIQTKFNGWFGSRMPVGDKIRLNQRSTYIMPTRAGYLVMAVGLLMMVGATNYQNNLAFLLTFLLAGIGLVCIVFTFKNLQGIIFVQGSVDECFVGTPFSVSIRLQSQTGQQHLSIAIGQSKDSLVYCNVPQSQEALIHLTIDDARRGYWQLPRLMAFSEFPFGWFQTWAYFRFKRPVLVYPRAIEPPALYQLDSGGEEKEEGSKAIGSEELYGLRAYMAGESLSRVDWKAYARERGMFVREFASYQSQQLCFNWRDFYDCELEKRLSYLTFLVINAASQNLTYSLVLPDQHIIANSGEKHRRQCLKALALFQQEDA